MVDQNLCGANGNVLGIARSGNTLYIAGSFRSVGDNSGGFAPLDARTGQALGPFPKVAGSVYAIAPDGSGGWYLGGEFTGVGGQPRACLAQVRADGSVTDWNPGVSGSPGYIDPPGVHAIAVSNGRVFVGGAFRNIGGLPHRNLACVDAKTGAALNWDMDTNDGDARVYALASHDSTVFVGGWFSSLAGQPRYCLAAVDESNGALNAWQPDPDNSVWALIPRGDTLLVAGAFGWIGGGPRTFLAAVNVRTAQLLPLDAHPDWVYLEYAPAPSIRSMALAGDTLYVGGDFTQIGGRALPTLAALNVATGQAFEWTPATLGFPASGSPPDICYAIAVTSGTVYAGGSWDFAGGLSRPSAAGLDRVTGEVTAWNPRPDLPIDALAVKGDTVYAGGEFSLLGEWTHRAGLAAIDLSTGRVKPWNPNPNGGLVTAVATRGDRVFVSGDFTSIGGDPQPRNNVAALDTLGGLATGWNPGANGLVSVFAVTGDTLYAGGEFSEVGGLPRSHLAAISATSGEVLGWDPNADLPVLAMSTGEGVIYVGGLFDQIGGRPRGGIAAVDAVTGALSPWDPGTDNNTVDALLFSGGKLYVGGGFGMIGGQPRNAIAALDPASGLALPWNPQIAGWGEPARVRAFALADSQLCIGGSFSGIGGQSRVCLAAVDTATGLATDWDPGLDGLVWSLATSGSTTFVGGGFARAGGIPADGLAAFFSPRKPLPAPTAFALARSVPNPARSTATFQFSLPEAAITTLSVYDLQGRRAHLVLDHVLQTAGPHAVPLRLDGWTAGVYFCRLEAGGRSATRKMVVVQ